MTAVAIIGSTGQLGTDLVKVFQAPGRYDVFALTHGDIECSDPISVEQVLSTIRPDVVVNCAAFVRVDECEDQVEDAFRVNAIGACYVAKACAKLRAKCIYISTDYVFDGRKGETYTEDDIPNPINVYGASKLAGEFLMQQACSNWLIVRVACMFGKAGTRGKGGNFIETILSKASAGAPVRVVRDITISPTYTLDAAHALESLVRSGGVGVYHLTNVGSCTWYELARTAMDLAGISAPLEPIPSAEYSTRARRPPYSALTSARIPGRLRHWKEALRAYLTEKGVIVS